MEKINVVYFRAKRAEIGGKSEGGTKTKTVTMAGNNAGSYTGGGGEIVIEEKAR